MGLRSPQQMKTTALRDTPTTRFAGVKAPELDTRFIGNLQKTFSEQEQEQVRQKKAAFELMKTQAENDAENEVINAQAALTDSRGLDALKTKSDQTKELGRVFDKRVEKLPEEYRPAIRAALESKLVKYNRFAAPYATGQIRQAEDGAYKTKIANEVNDAVQTSGDLEVFGTDSLQKVTSAITEHGQRMGLAKDQILYNVASGVSDTIRKGVEQQAKIPGGMDRAEALLAKHDAELLPADRVKAYQMIKTAKDDGESREALTLSEMAWKQTGGDPAAMEEYVRTLAGNDKIARQSQAFIISRLTAERRTNKMQEEATTADIYKSQEQGADPRTLMQKALTIKDPETKNRVIDNLKKFGTTGGNRISNPAVLGLLQERYQTDPDWAKATDPLAYKNDLSPEDLKTLQAKRARYLKADSDEVVRAQLGTDKEKTAWVNKFLDSKGILDDKEMRGQMHMLADSRYEQLLAENPKASRRDIRNQLYLELESKGLKTTKSGGFNVFGWQIIDEDEETVPNTGLTSDFVHPSYRAEIKRRNPQYTDSQVNAALNILKANEKDLSKPWAK